MTFPLTYAFSENYILPLSHDEVVHSKGSLLNKMPGNYKDKFAGLRAYYVYMMAHPGKKLLFMGGEFGQFSEWDHTGQLDWALLNYDSHNKLKQYVKDLNHLYLAHKAMWEQERDWKGFRWLVADDSARNIIAFLRIGIEGQEILIISNFSPVARTDYLLSAEENAEYILLLDSNHIEYGGSGEGAKEVIAAHKDPVLKQSAVLTDLPPLSTLYYQLR